MKRQQRLQKKINDLNTQWNTLRDKLSRLEQAKITETDVSQQIKLDAQIAEDRKNCDDIERQLDVLENELARFPVENINKLVFINADASDTPLCENVCQLLKEEELAEYVEFKIDRQQTPEEIREAFEAWILDCDALVVIYGQVGFGWLNHVFKNVRRIVWQRAEQPLPAYVLCDPHPEQKQRLQCSFHGISVIHYESCSNETKFREFINHL